MLQRKSTHATFGAPTSNALSTSVHEADEPAYSRLFAAPFLQLFFCRTGRTAGIIEGILSCAGIEAGAHLRLHKQNKNCNIERYQELLHRSISRPVPYRRGHYKR